MAHHVAVRLPLPIPIVSRLGQAVEAAWPGLMVTTNHELSSDHLVFVVPDDWDDNPIEPLPPAPASDPGVVAWLRDLGDGTIGMSLPDRLVKIIGALSASALDELGAENYVEMHATSPDDDRRLVVTAQRTEPGTLTPHEARLAAEAERDLLRQVVRKMNRLMPGPRGREVMLTTDEHAALRGALAAAPDGEG